MMNYIKSKGGEAKAMTPVITRPNWNDVKEYLEGKINFATFKKENGMLKSIKLFIGLISFVTIATLLSSFITYSYYKIIRDLYYGQESFKELVYSNLLFYSIGTGIFYIPLIFMYVYNIVISKSSKIYLLLLIFIIEAMSFGLLVGTIKDLFTFHALTKIILLSFPVILINYFVWDKDDKIRNVKDNL